MEQSSPTHHLSSRRILQLVTLGAAGAAASALVRAPLRLLAPTLGSLRALWGVGAGVCAALLGRRQAINRTVPATDIGPLTQQRATLLRRRLLSVWEPGMAPADVLAKTLQPVTDVISAEDRGTVQEEGEGGEQGQEGAQEEKPVPFEYLKTFVKGGLPNL